MLRNSTINFLLLKLNQWLNIFFIVVFTHRLLNSSIFVSIKTLMDGMMKNVMILNILLKFLNLFVLNQSNFINR